MFFNNSNHKLKNYELTVGGISMVEIFVRAYDQPIYSAKEYENFIH